MPPTEAKVAGITPYDFCPELATLPLTTARAS